MRGGTVRIPSPISCYRPTSCVSRVAVTRPWRSEEAWRASGEVGKLRLPFLEAFLRSRAPHQHPRAAWVCLSLLDSFFSGYRRSGPCPSRNRNQDSGRKFCREKDLLKREFDAPREHTPIESRCGSRMFTVTAVFIDSWGWRPLLPLSPLPPQSMLKWVLHAPVQCTYVLLHASILRLCLGECFFVFE